MSFPTQLLFFSYVGLNSTSYDQYELTVEGVADEESNGDRLLQVLYSYIIFEFHFVASVHLLCKNKTETTEGRG